jgi:hypothetical protein
MFVYSVKVLCGSRVPPLSITEGAQGRSFEDTVVNIHNFNPDWVAKQITISWKVSIGPSIGSDVPGIITPYHSYGLTPNRSVRIECGDVYQSLGASSDSIYVEGFVEIVSPFELSVVAVHREWICVPNRHRDYTAWRCQDGAQLEIVRYTPFQVQIPNAGN